MQLCSVLFALLGIMVLSTSAFLTHYHTDVQDFDATKSDYEFVYHDSTNLMLIIKEDNCYFRYFSDDKEYLLSTGHSSTNGGQGASAREKAENFYIGVITQNDPGTLVPATLDEMRDSFQDLLADFRCMDKNIFKMIINGQ